MKFFNYMLLITLAILWGPSFLFIKIAGAEILPLTLAALRVGIAALVLGMYVFLIKRRFTLNRMFWLHVTVSGFFAQALPFVLINWGEQYISSALAAILNGLTPLFTIFLANYTTKTDKLNPWKLGGSLLGFIGLSILLMPSFGQGLTGSTLGILAVTLAAFSYGIALVYSKTFLQSTKPLMAPTGQLIMSSVILIPLALIVDRPIFSDYSLAAYLSVGSLALFGTALAFTVYYALLTRTNSSFVAQVTYLMPIFGVVLGYTFLNETLSFSMLFGGLIILMAMVFSNLNWNFSTKKGKECQTTVCS